MPSKRGDQSPIAGLTRNDSCFQPTFNALNPKFSRETPRLGDANAPVTIKTQNQFMNINDNKNDDTPQPVDNFMTDPENVDAMNEPINMDNLPGLALNADEMNFIKNANPELRFSKTSLSANDAIIVKNARQ